MLCKLCLQKWDPKHVTDVKNAKKLKNRIRGERAKYWGHLQLEVGFS